MLTDESVESVVPDRLSVGPLDFSGQTARAISHLPRPVSETCCVGHLDMPRTHLLTIRTATPFTSLLDHGPALASLLQPCPSGLSPSLEPSDLPRTQI